MKLDASTSKGFHVLVEELVPKSNKMRLAEKMMNPIAPYFVYRRQKENPLTTRILENLHKNTLINLLISPLSVP
jgi:hypothetical protein